MMRLKANMIIYTYWNALRRDGRPPLREHMNPMALAPYLPDIFVLSSIAEHLPCFRLAGTGLYDRFRKELRGFPFSELWGDSTRLNANTIVRNTTQNGSGTVISAVGITDEGTSSGLFEMLLLPLRTKNPNEVRLLGTLLPGFSSNTEVCAPMSHLSIVDYMPVSIAHRQSA